MKRATLGAILVIAIAAAAGFAMVAATTGDDDEPNAGRTPIGLSKCREDDQNCLARIGADEGDPAGGGATAGSCLVGTNCEDTPDTPTKADEKSEDPGAGPATSLGVCAPDTPDCVETTVMTTSGITTSGGEQ